MGSASKQIEDRAKSEIQRQKKKQRVAVEL